VYPKGHRTVQRKLDVRRVDHLSPGDEARAFGQFRWSAFTPAGAVERSGFFVRQAVRRSEHPEWQRHHHVTVAIGWTILAVLYGGIVFLVLAGVLHRTLGFP
jgi:hypothetical protein